MSKPTPLQRAAELLGQSGIATACGVTQPAVAKWVKKGRMPRTEYSGETNYAERITALCAAKGESITRNALLGLPEQGEETAAERERRGQERRAGERRAVQTA